MNLDRSTATQLMGTALCVLLAVLYVRAEVPQVSAVVEADYALALHDTAIHPPKPSRPSRSKERVASSANTSPASKKRSAVSTVDALGITQLIIPVLGVRADQLRDTFNDARGQGRRHDAIDIMAAHLTPVLAAADGVVMKRDNGSRGGISLYVLGADRKTVYYYAHLDHYEEGTDKGAPVRAGDVIAYVGNTGNAGPGNYHLHFEITTTSDPSRYWGGVEHNPYPLLRKGITVKN